MSSIPPIGLQLYTLREALAEDFNRVIERVAAIGYAGIEPFGTPDNPDKLAAQYHALGLQISSAHLPLLEGDNIAKTLAIAEAFGLERIVSMLFPDDFKTLDDVKRTCDRVNAAGRVAAEHGLTLAYHNHWWEFEPVEGQSPFPMMLQMLDPAIVFEVDVYWVQVAGFDPVEVVRDLGHRAPLLHIKDGPAETPPQSMVAVGEGAVDIPGVVQAGAGSTEWLIVELDRCATDMMEAVEKSFNYLAGEGFGRGRQS